MCERRVHKKLDDLADLNLDRNSHVDDELLNVFMPTNSMETEQILETLKEVIYQLYNNL